MCLIIVQPAGHTLSRAEFADIYDRNPDGFGIMVARAGKLHTHRTVGTLEEARAMYSAHGAGRACVLHWRYATHGTVSLDNAHPFTLTPDVAFVHNGMLSCGTPDANASDTAHMARHILAPIARDNPAALFTDTMRAVLSPLIGTGNKFVVMDRTGAVSIFNRAQGVDHRGRWYSNTYAWSAPAALTYRPARYYTPQKHTGYPTPALAPVAPAAGQLDATTGARDWFDAGPLDVLDLLSVAIDVDGEAGALRWALANSMDAADLVADWYTTDSETVLDLLDTDPAAVAEWLVEINTAAA